MLANFGNFDKLANISIAGARRRRHEGRARNGFSARDGLDLGRRKSHFPLLGKQEAGLQRPNWQLPPAK